MSQDLEFVAAALVRVAGVVSRLELRIEQLESNLRSELEANRLASLSAVAAMDHPAIATVPATLQPVPAPPPSALVYHY